MADDRLTERIRRALARVPGVTERKMFGSTAFLVRGKLCLSGRAERMMCRIDPAIHEVAVARPGCRTVVMKGQVRRGYVYVDAGALRTPRTLQYWVDRALAYNASLG